ncbi:M23 family metallopeptidase [Cryobacterium sp. SO2]|uniref:M23 family metallopeptidase n=1 Tax=Cryobacterium sp. SO2 TaxID=1897060 RepID=UPI0023D9A0FF|nr:M23 family metallopeptidase [Cryobacterium sp. SO2]WEO76969.1 M23 family metallopeptidase [Cryobacterium sp. SO2]
MPDQRPAPVGPVVPVTPEDEAPSLAASRAASALAAAETTHADAQAAYDAARLDLSATLADHDAALTRVDEVRALADAAVVTADASTKTLAALVRAMVQQSSDTTAFDALLGAQGEGDLLARLGSVDRLASLTGNISEIRDRVELDTARSNALQADFAAAQEAAAAFPVAAKQEALAAAELTLSQATAALAAAAENARIALAESAEASADRSAEATSQLAGVLGARLSNQGWATPAVGIINDGFGPRPDLPLPGVEPFHSGTDLGAACGTPIYAASAGTVIQTGQLGTYGNWILIDHGDGVNTGYAHIRDGATLVQAGDTVTAGQVIAGVGSTGASTGCHLHIEVRVDGTAIDPQPFFAAHGIDLGAG